MITVMRLMATYKETCNNCSISFLVPEVQLLCAFFALVCHGRWLGMGRLGPVDGWEKDYGGGKGGGDWGW